MFIFEPPPALKGNIEKRQSTQHLVQCRRENWTIEMPRQSSNALILDFCYNHPDICRLEVSLTNPSYYN
jgi:hypothetical protein